MDNIYRFKVTGNAPLLTSNWEAMLEAKPVPKNDQENIKQALDRAYRDADGYLQFPVVGVRNSLVSGAKHEKIGDGSGVKVAGTSLLKATVFITQEFTPLLINNERARLDLKTAKVEDFDRRRAVNSGRARGSIIRWRPIFRNWSLHVDFELDPATWGDDSLPILLNYFQKAGSRVGLGDFRPACGGWFGRYSVELVGKVS